VGDDGRYNMGRHDRVFSLVLPIAADALWSSPAYRDLERDLRSACFARKIDWSLLDRRKDKLHATICGSLNVGDAPILSDAQRRSLVDLGPLQMEVRGLFSGNVNIGRLYLKVYPERANGRNMCQEIQDVLGRPITDLYLVGVFNFTDHLNTVEAAALEKLLLVWWDRSILQVEADQLWLLGATDDLVLDGVVAETIALT